MSDNNSKPKRRVLLSRITNDDFTRYVQESSSWKELLSKCGYSFSKSLQERDQYPAAPKRQCMKRIEKLKLDYKHLGYQLTPLSKLSRNRRCRTHLLKKLAESGRPYICEWCKCKGMDFDENDGEWMWNGKVLKLQVDHINGIRVEDPDNVNNLRTLCPNCHTQTDTFCGRQRWNTKREWTSRHRKQKLTVS